MLIAIKFAIYSHSNFYLPSRKKSLFAPCMKLMWVRLMILIENLVKLRDQI